MKVKTMKTKLIKYAKLLDPIIDEALDRTTNENLNRTIKIYVMMDSPYIAYNNQISIASSDQSTRSIHFYYQAYMSAIRSDFNIVKKLYEKHTNEMQVTRKQFDRTKIIHILIHEMCHMEQFIPPQWLWIVSNRYHKIQVARQFEHAVELKVCYIFIRYHTFLHDQFNILPFGVSFVFYFILAAAQVLSPSEFSEFWNNCDPKWDHYVELVLPVLKSWKVKAYGFYINRNEKFRMASTDYQKAVYEGCQEALQELKRVKINGDAKTIQIERRKIFLTKYRKYRKLYALEHKKK